MSSTPSVSVKRKGIPEKATNRNPAQTRENLSRNNGLRLHAFISISLVVLLVYYYNRTEVWVVNRNECK